MWSSFKSFKHLNFKAEICLFMGLKMREQITMATWSYHWKTETSVPVLKADITAGTISRAACKYP